VPAEEGLADHEVDDGIAEELEALEVLDLLLRMFMEVRAVRERRRQQRRVAEPVAIDLVFRSDLL